MLHLYIKKLFIKTKKGYPLVQSKIPKYQNNKKIYYSCVIDDNPKFYYQGFIFVNSLINIAKVKADRIFVHLVAKNPQFENFLKEKGINIKFIEPWGDKKYCNKLQQLETKELRNADFIWFCDADIAILEDLANLVESSHGNVLAKIVDSPQPSLDKLKKIYDFFNIEYPYISTDTLINEETFAGNFNGGLYGIPSKHITAFSNSWKKYAKEMLSSKKIKEILEEAIIHIDQVSFSLALKTLELNYEILGYEYNCPTHIGNEYAYLLDNKLKHPVKVIHYHNNLTNTGLLNQVASNYLKESIDKVNKIIKDNFNNSIFWNYRYETNPELGSGTGSRGGVAMYKLNLLKNIGIEKDSSLLDIGCGDLEIIKKLSLKNYTGVDISEHAVLNAKTKLPKFNFYNFDLEKEKIPSTDTVLCLDVLIHQPKKEKYDELINFISNKAIKRVIVSGYEAIGDNSNMCFYYENIRKSLEKMGVFKYIYKVGEYRGLGVYIADKELKEGTLLETRMPNDINNDIIDKAIQLKDINSDLLLETIIVSRANFSWYTKHYPRLYEYPWLLEKLGRNLENMKIADLGAGVTPLPLQLAQRGANVYTIDTHEKIQKFPDLEKANEWGFFDYNTLNSKITSYNQSLCESVFKKNSLDVWYSISVIEHMPSFIRESVLKIIYNTLKPDGRLFLTVDLVKNSNKLWNMAEGKIVEDELQHGTFESFLEELENLGFIIEEKDINRMPKNERVDIAMISGIKKIKSNKLK